MALRSKVQSQQKTSEEIGDVLDALEKLIERTKVMYEQYFMGIQKMAPMQLHREVERTIRELTQEQIRNTSLRYRFNTLTQKFGTYNTYWKRTMRKIEQGTYHRHVEKVGRKAVQQGEEIPDELLASMPKLMRRRIEREREKLSKKAARDRARRGEKEAGEDTRPDAAPPASVNEPHAGGPIHHIDEEAALGDADLNNLDEMFEKITDDSAPSRPPPSRPPRPQSPRPPRSPRASSLPPGMSEEKSRQLYQRYKKARKLVGGRTDDMSYEKLMGQLRKQAPKIMEQHRAKAIDFNVVIKGDKVVLKAKPKK